MVLGLRGVTVRFGGLTALSDVGLEVDAGELVGLIGPNGAGKSTLLKIFSEITAPTSGEIRLYGRLAALIEVGSGFHEHAHGSERARADRMMQRCRVRIEILARRASGPRILRQPADHQHGTARTKRLGFIDGPAVVVARFVAPGVVGGEHPGAAIARQIEAGVADRARRAIEPDLRDLIAPWIDGPDAVAGASVDDGEQITLLADRCGIDREPAMIGGEVSHRQASIPRVARTERILATALSGSRKSTPRLSERFEM